MVGNQLTEVSLRKNGCLKYLLRVGGANIWASKSVEAQRIMCKN
jgi:hypothetical protein